MDDTIRRRPGVREGYPRRRRKTNYRLMLCGALAVCLILAVLFFALFLNQRGKTKDLEEQVKKLTEQTQTLTGEKTALQSTLDGMYDSAIAELPDPTTAQTEALPDLIPQLTDSIYLVRSTGSGYQYLKIPSGILADKLTAYRDAADYTAAASGVTADLWVLYDDKVIGIKSGTDAGFVSTDRTASGAEYTLPSGFSAFVSSFFA